jgi:hypothetical protein
MTYDIKPFGSTVSPYGVALVESGQPKIDFFSDGRDAYMGSVDLKWEATLIDGSPEIKGKVNPAQVQEFYNLVRTTGWAGTFEEPMGKIVDELKPTIDNLVR